MAANLPVRIIDSRHPNFLASSLEWDKWRLTYRGGDEFRNRYLEQFTSREDQMDFQARKKMTPIPSYAKAALNDIRYSIFQRMRDIIRRDGSLAYQRAIAGMDSGVDRRGSTMNAFLGTKVLTDLLVMGQTGIFVDNSLIRGETLADAMGARPYLYPYQVEDILNMSFTNPEQPSEFQSLLLRDTCMEYDRRSLLPVQTFQRFRLLWIDSNTGLVNLQFYDPQGKEIDRDGLPAGPLELQLTRIPFVLLDIGDSLIRDVCQHQIAMLNLGSSDINYALKSNFPFYVEQRDLRTVGGHLKQAANPDGTATSGGQGAHDNEIQVGANQGRYYDMKAEMPAFIAPPSAPLEVSMKLQDKLEADIRKLVNLSVTSMASNSSGAALSLNNQGLEAGLSFIGLVLESAERRVAEFWAAYEDKNPNKRTIATIKYPDRYSLKTDADRIDEAKKLSELMYTVPGETVKREIGKTIVQSLLGGKINMETIQKISDEIDNSPYATSDPNTIILAFEAGIVSGDTASLALGFEEGEYEKAQEDHAERVATITAAQANGDPAASSGDPAARGAPDLSGDPANAGATEKKASRDTTLKDSTKKPIRGAGRFAGKKK